jgi:hypothetical protein
MTRSNAGDIATRSSQPSDQPRRLEACNLAGQIGQPFGSSLGIAVLDDDVPALDVTEFPQALSEGPERGLVLRPKGQHPTRANVAGGCAVAARGAVSAITEPHRNARRRMHDLRQRWDQAEP